MMVWGWLYVRNWALLALSRVVPWPLKARFAAFICLGLESWLRAAAGLAAKAAA